MNYLNNLNKKTLEYFNVLESNFPEWLNEYINTKEMLKQQYISMTCGTMYSDLFGIKYYFSSLDHAIGVALIIWHFTHDKKQTLAGLFHDIATPVFKHCVDFMDRDYILQETTENLTTKTISESREIMSLLKRDNILLEEVNDYHKYAIADNDIPKLSSDRLEYSLSGALLTYNLLDLDEIREIYEDIEVQKNEYGDLELSFRTKSIARKFVKVTSRLGIVYRDDRARYSMQLLADIIKKLNDEGKISRADLYEMKESEVIEIIEKSKYKDVYNIWKRTRRVKTSNERPKDVYYVKIESKVRYINPLVNGRRISDICKIAKNMIEKNLEYDMSKYVYIDEILFF